MTHEKYRTVSGPINSTELFYRAKELGIAHDHHESDLYLIACSDARDLIASYLHKANVSTFIHQVHGNLWYDIPFAYTPFWEAKGFRELPKAGMSDKCSVRHDETNDLCWLQAGHGGLHSYQFPVSGTKPDTKADY
jgi:hypothetical protein